MKPNIRVLILSILFFSALAMQANNANSSEQRSTEMMDVGDEYVQEISDEAEVLKGLIRAEYERLEFSGEIKSMGNGRNDIAEVVKKVIKPDMPFERAERVLKAAGFEVGPRGQNFLFPKIYEVSAKIESYSPTVAGRTGIYISLQPKSAEDWSVIFLIQAEIIRQFI